MHYRVNHWKTHLHLKLVRNLTGEIRYKEQRNRMEELINEKYENKNIIHFL